jgi:putative ABC transport system permease protein
MFNNHHRQNNLTGRLIAFLNWTLVGIRTGMIEMRSNLLRSILSAIGVLFGVFVMVVMLSLIGGLNTFLNDKMGEWLGSVFVWELRDPPEEKKAQFSRSRGLRFADGSYLETEVDAVEKVYKFIDRRERITTIAGEQRARFRGVDSNALAKVFTSNIELTIREGSNLNTDDFRKGNKVCLISSYLAGEIKMKMQKTGKDTANLLGSNIVFNHQRFKVVGVYGSVKGEIRRHWLRYNVYVPLLAMQKYVTGYNPDPGYLWLQIRDPLRMDAELFEVLSALLYRHRGVEDFEYRKPDHLQEFISMMKNVGTIMGIIALISLLAGGLGIMNVMLSSISERVREIGIRKALGASNLQLFVQFIAETSTLCFVGGIIGALLGCIPMAFGEAIEKATDGVINPTLLPQYILAVFMILVSMGVVFGLYPALKASRMNPIDALRYE